MRASAAIWGCLDAQDALRVQLRRAQVVGYELTDIAPAAGSMTTTAQVRYVVRFGSSDSVAQRNLKVAMVDRLAAAGAADLTRNSEVTDLSTAWLLEVDASYLAKSTKARYSTTVVQFIDPGIGQRGFASSACRAVDRFLRVVRGGEAPGDNG